MDSSGTRELPLAGLVVLLSLVGNSQWTALGELPTRESTTTSPARAAIPDGCG
jgi:hypothetical protein